MQTVTAFLMDLPIKKDTGHVRRAPVTSSPSVVLTMHVHFFPQDPSFSRLVLGLVGAAFKRTF